MTIRETTEQMNSDMHDGVNRNVYDISKFSPLEIAQAKESFSYNGYKVYEKDNELSIKKLN